MGEVDRADYGVSAIAARLQTSDILGGMTTEWLDEDRVRHMRDAFLHDALPIRQADVINISVDGVVYEAAMVWLDAATRPDVADVGRVIQIEGIQERAPDPLRFLHIDGQGYMLALITITDPITCAFSFVLTWPKHRELFHSLVRQGTLYVTTDDFAMALQSGRALGLRVDQQEMQRVVSMWTA